MTSPVASLWNDSSVINTCAEMIFYDIFGYTEEHRKMYDK